MTRVIGNLLTNARKYNRTGKEIRIKLSEQEQVTLRVEDDGEEISPDVRDAMFHAFVRGERQKQQGRHGAWACHCKGGDGKT